MSALSNVIPVNFPALALAHFFALLSPGPDFFLIVGHAARRKLAGAAGICLGIALGNAIYIGLAIAGWAGLKQSPELYRTVELVGGAYLLWMGRALVRSGRAPGADRNGPGEDERALGPLGQCAAGLASALLNPKNAIFYLTLMTGILGPQASLAQQVTAGVWMAGVVLAWDLTLAACISSGSAQAALRRKIPMLETAAGFVLLGMAVMLLWSTLRSWLAA